MAKRGSSAWVSTSEAAKALGVSSQFLLRQRGELFQQGKHWRTVNPHAYRPTYRWHLTHCEMLLDGIDK